MATQREFRILVATDGSRQARAAVATTLQFPWPEQSRVRVISARQTRTAYRRAILLTALDRGAQQAAESARRALARRWPDVDIEIAELPAVEGILGAADRFHADVIVIGWRGHGAVRRLLMGSVSRGVVRGSKCAVLVAQRSHRVRSIVVGVDPSEAAQRALALVRRLVAPRDGRVTLVTATALLPAPSRSRVPGASTIAREVRRQNKIQARAATKTLERAAAALKSVGWHPRTRLVHGEPLRELLGTVAASRAQLLVVGARATKGARYLLLGSVAEGALNRTPVAVLVAR